MPEQGINDVPGFDLSAITHYFEVYEHLELGKSVDASHWEKP
ncbi:hypothetical protein ACFXPY_41860 [Streptomyces sp. NPDC059153]